VAKKALGMGIDALLGTGEEKQVSSGDITRIAVDRIDPNPDQPRKKFNEDSLNEMAESIRAQGIIQPVILEPAGSRYTLVAGERRFRAAKRAELTEIPAIIRSFTAEEKIEIALIENLQREDLNPIEEAEAYRLIMERGNLNQAEVAIKVGKQRSTIANSLRLLKLPKEMKNALEDGEISAGHARALLAVENPERRQAIFDRILKDGLSVREAENLADRSGKISSGTGASGKKQRRSDRLGPELLDIREQLIEKFGTKVSIKGNESHGKIEIAYFSMEDLERILEVIDNR